MCANTHMVVSLMSCWLGTRWVGVDDEHAIAASDLTKVNPLPLSLT
jgi:hypothetical protein